MTIKIKAHLTPRAVTQLDVYARSSTEAAFVVVGICSIATDNTFKKSSGYLAPGTLDVKTLNMNRLTYKDVQG